MRIYRSRDLREHRRAVSVALRRTGHQMIGIEEYATEGVRPHHRCVDGAGRAPVRARAAVARAAGHASGLTRAPSQHPPTRRADMRAIYSPAWPTSTPVWHGVPDSSGTPGTRRRTGRSTRSRRPSASRCFFNAPLVVAADPAHSGAEERFFAPGQMDAGRLLLEAFTLRGTLLRVIPVRPMSRREREVCGDARAEEGSE